MPGQFQRLPISPADLERWESVGLRLNHVPELSLSLFELRTNPSRTQLEHAAVAARYAASTIVGPAKAMAVELAEELEQRAA
jgi:hypothetical protein